MTNAAVLLAALLLGAAGCTTYYGNEARPKCTTNNCDRCLLRCAASNSECRAHCFTPQCGIGCDQGHEYCVAACPDVSTVQVSYREYCLGNFCSDRQFGEE